MTRNKLFALAGIAGMAALFNCSAIAQSYPNKPIRVIQGNPAGSVVDLSARPILDEMSRRLGQPIVVDFRPGANSIIGAKAAMAAAPDGYTLFYSNVMQSHSIFNSANAVDAGRDLQPVSQFVVTPWILVARATLPAATLSELVAYAKANPGKLKNGAAAPSVSLAMAFLGARAGVQSESIPFKSSPQVLTSLLAGDVDLTLGSVTTYQAQIQAGKLRAIAAMGAKRSPLLPNVPSLPEAGVKDFDVPAYYGLWAPLGTPKDIVQKLSAEAVAATKVPAIVEQLRRAGAEVLGTTPEEQMRIYEYEVKFWTEAARIANYKPE